VSYHPPQPAWGAPMPMPMPMAAPAPVRLREHEKGTTVLVLGFLSLVPLLFPLGIAAWVMGNKAAKEIDVDRWAWGNRGSVVVGRLLGAVGTIVGGLAVGLLTLLVVALLATGTANDQKPIPQGAQVGPAAVQPHAGLADALGPPSAG
jgi:hypothetical protein